MNPFDEIVKLFIGRYIRLYRNGFGEAWFDNSSKDNFAAKITSVKADKYRCRFDFTCITDNGEEHTFEIYEYTRLVEVTKDNCIIIRYYSNERHENVIGTLRDLPDEDNDIQTVSEFIEAVNGKLFTSNDGFGEYIVDTGLMVSRLECTGIRVAFDELAIQYDVEELSKHLKIDKGNISVVWFNK